MRRGIEWAARANFPASTKTGRPAGRRLAGMLPASRFREFSIICSTVSSGTEAHFRRNRRPAAQALRCELGSRFPIVRMRAAFLLGELGDLHDIRLLSDLLNLEDTLPGERRILLTAIRRLSGVNRQQEASGPVDGYSV